MGIGGHETLICIHEACIIYKEWNARYAHYR